MPIFPTEKFLASVAQIEDIFESDPLDASIRSFLDALDLNNLGPWYVIAAGVAWVSFNQGSETKKAVNSVGEIVLEQPQAMKQIEIQLAELTTTTNLLSEELNGLKIEKGTMAREMASMQKELKSMQVQVEATKRSEEKLRRELMQASDLNTAQAKKVIALEAEKVCICERPAAL
jgi:hypothetical protein